ncbi:MAG: ABC transporter permease [Gemmataceae bacterium]|nr:ABC transporter permease [Gemmataceae bacterium]
MSDHVRTLLAGGLLVLVQALAAVPWVLFLLGTRDQARQRLAQAGGLLGDTMRTPVVRLYALWLLGAALVFLAGGFLSPYIVGFGSTVREDLEGMGRHWTALLQAQLTIDLFLLLFWIILKVWPKGGAIALAAFYEGTRQPVFWMLFGFSCLLMVVWTWVPYFTFGEDYLMVKQLGYDTIMLAAVVFGCLGASLSVSEEIEGRSAITVMSKPVSRRQFMLGKFLGIMLGALFLFGLLTVVFQEVLVYKHWWDKLDTLSSKEFKDKLTASGQAAIGVVPTPSFLLEWVEGLGVSEPMTHTLRGVVQWAAHTADTLPGMALCFSQVMVLVALAVALATRLPIVVNLVTVLVVFFLAHLTPKLLAVAARQTQADPDAPVGRILGFVAQVFDTILPDLGAFSMDPALLSEAPPPAELFLRYVGAVTLYGVVYTGIVLLLGLILFEDRDLA